MLPRKVISGPAQEPLTLEEAKRFLRITSDAEDDVVASGLGDPVAVARGAVEEARRRGRDVLIVDTAGRLAIDAEMMEQVRQISDSLEPDYTFLVVDAMTGQDAVTVAESFHQTLELDAVILTKLDGDARGGAALSVKEVVGRPIAFASTGEKIEDFDLFHPDRLAGRILGEGDLATLIVTAFQNGGTLSNNRRKRFADRVQPAVLEDIEAAVAALLGTSAAWREWRRCALRAMGRCESSSQ